MKQWLGRLLLAIWFVGMVAVAVRGTRAQHPTSGALKQYFPAMMRNVPPSPSPSLHGYVGVGAANGDIYSVRADGTELRNLTPDGGGYALDPRFSADGSLISFLDSFGATRVMVMNRDGSEPRLLLEREFAERPQVQWAPTGRHVLVWGKRVNALTQKDLFLISLDHNTVEHLVDATASEEMWGWSPNGQFIHYQRGTAVLVRPTNGGTEVRLNVSTPIEVAWHPWRHELFLWEYNGTGFEGRIASSDGTVNRLLFTGEYQFQGWIRGQETLLLRNSEVAPFLFQLPRLGGTMEPLFPNSTSHTLRVDSVAPDGQGMVYTAVVSPTFGLEVYVYDFLSDTQYRLEEDNPYLSLNSITWSPDNRGLIYVILMVLTVLLIVRGSMSL